MGGTSSIAERTCKTCIQRARFAIIPESPAFRNGEYVKAYRYLRRIAVPVGRSSSLSLAYAMKRLLLMSPPMCRKKPTKAGFI